MLLKGLDSFGGAMVKEAGLWLFAGSRFGRCPCFYDMRQSLEPWDCSCWIYCVRLFESQCLFPAMPDSPHKQERM